MAEMKDWNSAFRDLMGGVTRHREARSIDDTGFV